MADGIRVLTAQDIQRVYGSFYHYGGKIRLEPLYVPEACRPLLPYAEFWGVEDDWTREDLVEQAPRDVRENLRLVVAAFDPFLDEWLAGPEADEEELSREYLAFTALRRAADSVM